MSVYRVNGPLPYREHQPGEAFEAELFADAERRAVARGDITLLDKSKTQIQPGTWSLPSGWANTERKENQ